MSEKHMNLLLVDDDDAIRQLLTEILTQKGYAVRTARDGFAALAAVRDRVPDILLSDLFMPGMSGFELLYVVCRRLPSIRVMAMSGAFSGQDVPEGVDAEAFYEKGTSPGHLLSSLADLTLPREPEMAAYSRKAATVWIPQTGFDAQGAACVLICCPDCLRAFPKVLSEPDELRLTGCLYCLQTIEYRVVQGPGPAAKPAFVMSLESSLPVDPLVSV